eukprot:1109838-Karenia_brevis.AAC.1
MCEQASVDRAAIFSRFVVPADVPVRPAASPQKKARKALQVPQSAKVSVISLRPTSTTSMGLSAAEKLADLKLSAGSNSEHWHEWRDLDTAQLDRFRMRLVASFERIPPQQLGAKLRTYHRLRQFAEAHQRNSVHGLPSFLLAEFLQEELSK